MENMEMKENYEIQDLSELYEFDEEPAGGNVAAGVFGFVSGFAAGVGIKTYFDTKKGKHAAKAAERKAKSDDRKAMKAARKAADKAFVEAWKAKGTMTEEDKPEE